MVRSSNNDHQFIITTLTGLHVPNSYAVVTLFEAICNCCFDDVSKRYGMVIIYDHLCVHHLLKGPQVPNSYAVVTLFEAIANGCFSDVSSQRYGEDII